MAFMAREDERRAAAADRAHKRELQALLEGQVAAAEQRRWVCVLRSGSNQVNS